MQDILNNLDNLEPADLDDDDLLLDVHLTEEGSLHNGERTDNSGSRCSVD